MCFPAAEGKKLKKERRNKERKEEDSASLSHGVDGASSHEADGAITGSPTDRPRLYDRSETAFKTAMEKLA